MKDALDIKSSKGSRLARIGIWTAVIGVLLALASGLGARVGLLDPFRSMAVYAVGGLLLFIALITAGLGLIRSGGTAGNASRAATWLALLAGVAVTANNLWPFIDRAPPIHDLTTDTSDPPAFVAVVPRRADARNGPEYAGEAVAAIQRQSYPELKPLVTTQPADQVFARALEIVEASGWDVAEANPTTGRIEATAETSWVRFKDDVVIRIRATEGGTTVDVRSKSRIGMGDMGANARRIRVFLAALEKKLAA